MLFSLSLPMVAGGIVLLLVAKTMYKKAVLATNNGDEQV